MATIGKYNFKSHYKGDTWDGAVFTFTDQDSNPIDLTGSTIRMKFRKGNINGAVSLSLDSLGNGIILSDAVNGVVTIQSRILDINSGLHFYDMEITFADSRVKTYVKGNITITQDITY